MHDLYPDEQEMLLKTETRPELKRFLGALLEEDLKKTYVTYLDDKDVPEKHRDTYAKWREYAASLGYTGPVVWQVREGFTLKRHAPRAGPCHKRFEYVHSDQMENEKPTRNTLVFWVPRLAEGSTNKTITEMEQLRGDLKVGYMLPNYHIYTFGSVTLLVALILTHFKRTGECVPLKNAYAVSDSFRTNADPRRFSVGNFSVDEGLMVDFCDDDRDNTGYSLKRDDNVGFFLLEVGS